MNVPVDLQDQVDNWVIKLATRTDLDYSGERMGGSKRQAEHVLQPGEKVKEGGRGGLSI